jgi:hypothetical protein
MSYHRDNRSEKEYESFVRRSWKEEDEFLKAINKALPEGVEFELSGSDKDRVFQSEATRKKVTSASDFVIKGLGKTLHVGFQTSFTKIKFLTPKETEQVSPIRKVQGVSVTYRKQYNDYVVFHFTEEFLSKNNEVFKNDRMGNKLTRFFSEKVVAQHTVKTPKDVADRLLKILESL